MRRRAGIARWTRGLGRALLGLLALAVVAACLLRLLRTPTGREWLLWRVQALVPGLEAHELRGNLTSELALVDVVLRDKAGKPVLRAAELVMRYNWRVLLRGRMRLERLVVVEPAFERPDDCHGLAALLFSRGIAVDVLEVQRDTLVLVGRLSTREASQMQLVAEVRVLPAPARGNRRSRSGPAFAIPELGIREARLWVEGGPERLVIRGRAVGPELQAQLRAVAAMTAGGRGLVASLQQLTVVTPRLQLTLLNRPRIVLYPGRLVQVAPTRLGVNGGEAELHGTFRPRGFPRLAGSLRLRDVQLPQLAEGQRATGQLEVTFGRQDLTGTATLRLTPGQAQLELTGRLPVRYSRGPLRPRVAWQRAAELRLRAQQFPVGLFSRLLPRLPQFGGTLDGNAALSGPLDNPVAQASLRVRGAQWDSLTGIDADLALALGQQATEVHSTVMLRGEPWLQLSGRAAVPLVRLLHRRLDARELADLRDSPLQLSLEMLPHDVDPLAKLAPALQRVRGRLAVVLRAGGTVLQPAVQLEISAARARLSKRVRVRRLRAELVAKVERNQTRAELELLEEGRPLLRAEVVAGTDLEQLLVSSQPRWREAPLSAELNLVGSLQHLQEIFGLSARPALHGEFLATVHAGGSLGQPELAFQLSTSDLWLDQTPLGSVSVSATYARARALEGTVVLQQLEGGKLVVRGHWQPGGEHAPQLRIDGEAIDLAVVHGLVPAIPESGGRLDLHLTTGGLLAAPQLAGELRLAGGRFRFLGISRIEDVSLLVRFAGEQARLVELRARARGGKLTASGSAQLRPLDLREVPKMPLKQFALALSADGFGLDVGAVEQAKFSGAIEARGQVVGQLLDAQAHVRRGVLRMPKIEHRTLYPTSLPPDVVFTDREARAAAEVARQHQQRHARRRPLRFRLRVRAEPLFVRGQDLAFDATANLTIFSDAARRVRLDGRISIQRGQITVFGNSFEVQRAEFLFSGEPEFNPGLNVTLTRRTAEATIAVELTGTLRDPKLTVSSDPPIYDSPQIMGLLVTGRIGEPAAPGTTADPSLAIAGAISQVLLGSLIKKVVPRIGIDVARVGLGARSRTATGEQTIRAEAELGKYITDRIYLAYRRVFGATSNENANEALLEYRITTRWLLMAAFGDAGIGGLDLVWSYAY